MSHPESLALAGEAAPAAPRVGVSVEFNARGMWEVPFWNLAARAGHRHLHRRSFPTAAGAAPDLIALGAQLEFSDDVDHGRQLWTYSFERGAVALLCAWGRQLEVLVLSSTPAAAAELAGELETVLRAPDADDDTLGVSYWTLTPSGPRRSHRRLDVPPWSAIADNYPSAVAAELASLTQATAPGTGRLLLWHGAPGTGKTTALRALTWAWRAWAHVHYVVDPEELFGRGAAYMTDVLIGGSARPDPDERTMLLVLEDAGELIQPDARRDTGQGLSRLLNISDGMLGQGIDALILITTNEPLDRLHPAVSRAGRCWSQLEFAPFAREEANRWLARRGADVRVNSATSLAELFALERGNATPQRPAFGFARSH
jgi:hypothetical protein